MKKTILLILLVMVSFSVKSQDLISGGANSWIFHTPDDRTSLLVAPKTNSVWDWAKATQFYNNGNVSFTGNVGIGTIIPSYLLHVDSENNPTIAIGTLNKNTMGKSSLKFFAGVSERKNGFSIVYNKTLTSDRLSFLDGGDVENLSILNGGNIGIGTITPDSKLTINNNSTDTTNGVFSLTNMSGNVNDVVSMRFNAGGGVSGTFLKHMRQGSSGADFGIFTSPTLTGTSQERFRITKDGYVGIGTTNPSAELDVNGNVVAKKIAAKSVGDSNIPLEVFSNDGSYLAYARQEIGGFGSVNVCNQSGVRRITLLGNGKANFYGNVGIGTEETGSHKLAVEGSIGAREIKVEATGWSDFVFEKEYNLQTLNEVEKHIKEKGHLKDIPSAKEVLKNGFYLGEMDAKLLQKIEELTLYTIQQEKKIREQERKMKEQEKELKSLKGLSDRLSKIEARLNTK